MCIIYQEYLALVQVTDWYIASSLEEINGSYETYMYSMLGGLVM